MTASGQLPQSNALGEAQADGLAEFMSRDPEGYSQQDMDRLIEALRGQRQRQQAAEAAGAKRPPKGDKGLLTKSPASAEDLGL